MGVTLHRFQIQNRSAVLRDRHGNFLENVPNGTFIGIRPTIGGAAMGQNWCTYIRIMAVLKGQWVWANEALNEAAFLDTGLPHDRPNTSTIRTSLV